MVRHVNIRKLYAWLSPGKAFVERVILMSIFGHKQTATAPHFFIQMLFRTTTTKLISFNSRGLNFTTT